VEIRRGEGILFLGETGIAILDRQSQKPILTNAA